MNSNNDETKMLGRMLTGTEKTAMHLYNGSIVDHQAVFGGVFE